MITFFLKRTNNHLNAIKIKITKKGSLVANYKEELIAKKMKDKNIVIDIDMGIGKENSTVWTCDLTQEYIKINADYRS